MLPIPGDCSGRNTAGPQAVAADHVASGRGFREEPVPGRDGTVPLVAAAGHEERQTDGHATPQCHGL